MTDNKLNIRPVIKNIGSMEHKSSEEKFQNTTLRPIIKLQHDLLVAYFENHLGKSNLTFEELNNESKIELMSKVFKNDNLFKTELKGLIIGHFTVNEYRIYQTMSSEMNKRIFTMVKERLLSVVL